MTLQATAPRPAETIDAIDRKAFRKLLDDFPELYKPLLEATALRSAKLEDAN